MTLTLTDEEARTLRQLLADHLPDLERETARTEDREMRRALARRRDLCERLIGVLEQHEEAANRR
ncbi:MAG: hypothetical protein ACT4PM_12880 [Gemmatimonadales bacterium]